MANLLIEVVLVVIQLTVIRILLKLAIFTVNTVIGYFIKYMVYITMSRNVKTTLIVKLLNILVHMS